MIYKQNDTVLNSCTTHPTIGNQVIVPCDRDAVEVQGGTAHQCPQKRPKTKTPRVEKCRVCRLIIGFPKGKRESKTVLKEPYQQKTRKEQKSLSIPPFPHQNPICSEFSDFSIPQAGVFHTGEDGEVR